MSERKSGPDRLLSPIQLGALSLRHRVIMAPLTRQRVDADHVPADIMTPYYVQRAGAGLIISESIAVGRYGAGWGHLPILETSRQIAGWRSIVEAVHAHGGLVAAQLFHPGRVHAESDANGRVGPWAVTDPTLAHELSGDEIRLIVQGFAEGARRASEAGFDAVEIHCGTGVMLDRFLRPAMNQREDAYGGSPNNRIRLHCEVVEAIAEFWPLDLIGIKLAPSALVNEKPDPWREETFEVLLDRLNAIGIAYAHFTRVTSEESQSGYGAGVSLAWLRARYRGALLAVNGYTRDEGEATLAAGLADAIVFGRAFIANPDLPRRFEIGAPIADADPDTFYTAGPEGLIDYPAADQ